MKKFLPIIIGFFAGMVSSGMMIYLDKNPVAFGEDPVSGWEDYQAWNGENLSWKSIFSNNATPGKDLYEFVGSNLILKPDIEAVKVIANIYHLTEQEADAAVKGSITVLFNNTATPKHMTTEQAYKMQRDIKDDYESYKELFDIQQEIDTSVAPTEMFANGDLQDSGFDLIYDLNVMEKILFNNVTEVTIGKPLTEDEGNIKSFLDAMPPTPKDNQKSTIPESGTNVVTVKDTLDAGGNPAKKAEIKIADKVLEADVVEDVCPSNNTLADSLGKFDEQNPPGSKNNPAGGANNGNGDPNGNAAGANGGNNNQNGQNPNGEGQGVKAATPSDFGGGFCGEAPDNPDAPAFMSLGDGGGLVAGASDLGFSVKVALCIKVELIKEKAVATSETSCIQCEINKINEAFNKTLSHSLIPNKATGNIMESATCKESYGTLLDFKVHLVPNPMPAKPEDDLILGKNIIDEWNKFVERYKPYGYGKWDRDTTDDYALNYLPPDTSSDELFLSMEATKAANLAQAKTDIAAMEIADEGTNMMLFSTPVLAQMKEMAGYFKVYRGMYLQTVDVCKGIQNKPGI
ncbi:MAG: hypothetical protein WCX95_01880 [Candidatus Gracilibacteria bacterium]